ncbi:TetR family transcriptional regulator [Frankia sp. CcI49]|uniref:TetR/AcrR family transcriptional regulator n=1 Tax=unclassified Frankia TaxID=2632575 RepID=UPI0006CA082E|nr:MULTISPECIES: TetR/AcrR family transcriptional regulator C-terminal domain-containing protein [unclassified Frankia]KPM51655.1 TetR family transcriptional regulator [Frankia sp. R43]ONH59277.1 TetR family transcriptional regulator [Frankia sp. CcI49]
MTAPDAQEDAPPTGAPVPPHRTPRGTLSRELLLDAAMEIVRIGGADAFSMRALGSRLEVDPTAFYRHFRTKNELLDALADILIAGDEPLPSTGDAQADLRESLHQLRRCLLRHPTMAAVILRRPPGGRAYWERANHAIGLLRGLGLTAEAATSVYQTLLFYCLGHVLSEARAVAAAVARDRRPGTPTATFNPPAHQLPDLAAAVPFLRADTRTQFNDGLDLILGSLPAPG